MLSPYQYASNRPIDGVDLDGLEFLKASDAQVEIIRGIVRLKVENMQDPARARINDLRDKMNFGWNSNEIGFNIVIGEINLQRKPVSPAQEDKLSRDPTHNPEKTDIQNPIAKSTNQPDGRYNQRSVPSGSVPNSKAWAKGVALVKSIAYVAEKVSNYMTKSELQETYGHARYAEMALFDVNTALQEGIIPEQYQNLESLSELANIVLQGESYLTKQGVINDQKLIDLGKRIFKEISPKRFNYLFLVPVQPNGIGIIPMPSSGSGNSQQQNSNSTNANKKKDK